MRRGSQINLLQCGRRKNTVTNDAYDYELFKTGYSKALAATCENHLKFKRT